MRRHRCVGGTSFNYSMDPLIVMIQSLNVHRIRVQSQVNALMRKTSQIKIENENHRVQGNGIDYRHHRISPPKKREELCMQEWVFVKCSFFSRRRVQREKKSKKPVFLRGLFLSRSPREFILWLIQTCEEKMLSWTNERREKTQYRMKQREMERVRIASYVLNEINKILEMDAPLVDRLK